MSNGMKIIGICSVLLLIVLSVIPFFEKVEAGYVGVKVYLLGTNKGVESEVLTPGYYWIGINEELYHFPTFQQTELWADTSDERNSFAFQTQEGMVSNVDVSVSYTVNKDKVHVLFQTYRKGLDEITQQYLRNFIRDSLNQVASRMTVEEAYGERKQELQDGVLKIVREKMNPLGINIDFIAFVGGIRPPESVVRAIDAKVAAKQLAQQRENEIQEAEAQAKKQEALALGASNARIQEAKGRAEAIRIEAEAQAEANKMLSSSLSENLIRYEQTKRWNGTLPQVSGSSTPFIDLRNKNN